MLPRIGVGAGVGALPAAAAIAGAAEGWCPWVIAGFALLTLIAVIAVPLSPYLPGLHRIPLIGSPTFRITLRLNGSLDMRVRVHDWANTSILEVGIKNLERSTVVKDVWMNFLMPSGIRMGRCDKVGLSLDDSGNWEPFHSHRLGTHARSDYWNDGSWTFGPRLSRVIRFKVRFSASAPGEYPVLFKLGAPGLYEDVEVPGKIYAEEVEEAELSPEDQMGALITEGEQLHRKYEGPLTPALYSDDEFRRDVLAYLIKSDPVITDAIGGDRLPQVPEDADEDELLVRVRETLDALYVVREERGRAAD